MKPTVTRFGEALVDSSKVRYSFAWHSTGITVYKVINILRKPGAASSDEITHDLTPEIIITSSYAA